MVTSHAKYSYYRMMLVLSFYLTSAPVLSFPCGHPLVAYPSKTIYYQNRRAESSYIHKKAPISHPMNFKVPLQAVISEDEDEEEEDYFIHYKEALSFLGRGSLVGLFTGIGVVVFKTSIMGVESLFYETLADALPKPAFYWPLALCK
jgi:hypothetical protein